MEGIKTNVYEGRFIDRSPYICPAGKVFGDANESMANCLREYKVDDKVTALQHDAKIWREDEFKPAKELPPFLNKAYLGTDQIKPILFPGVKTRFQTVINDLRETIYKSYWQKPLGKPRDPVPNLPKGLNPEEFTFGMPNHRITTAKDLVNPPKTVYEVQYDSQVGHDWYRKTHNNFNPSEQFTRKYEQPYDRNKRYGKRYNYDPRGVGMQCCTQWFMEEPTTYCSKIRADYVNKWRPPFGKPLAPYQNIKSVPEGLAFGNPTKWDRYSVPDLMKDRNVEPSEFKRQFLIWFQELTKLRDSAEKQVSVYDLNMREFLKLIIFNDKEKKGILPFDTVHNICMTSRLNFNKTYIRKLCKFLNILDKNDMLDYTRFVDMIDPKQPLIEIQKIQDIPEDHLYFTTSYQQAIYCDRHMIDHSAMPPAGIPSVRHDIPLPQKVEGQCAADIDSLGPYTTVKAVVNPNVWTNYGLNFRDFFAPRTADFMRKLFEKVGYEFPENSFEEIWKQGLEIDKTGLVCIDTFKTLLEQYLPYPAVKQEEEAPK